MKKILFIVTLLMCITIGISCDIYYDKSLRQMELIEIKVYDINGDEVTGEYKNYRTDLYQYNPYKDVQKKLAYNLKQINSAAPVENYYYLKVESGSTYTVHFIFYSKLNKKMESLELRNFKDSYYDSGIICDDIETDDDKNIICKYTFENISSDYFAFEIKKWENNGESKEFNTYGSNTYIKGVFFHIIDSEV